MRNLLILAIILLSCQTKGTAQWYLISEYDTTIILHDVYFHNNDTGFVVGQKYMDFIPSYPPFTSMLIL
ncbi:MAG: hypothetical protein K9H64_16170 [Bacteroidales bacterium]|nr:hypothetical protein [Bacteroidales bacterium]MCF8457505.1 hypothetical protein [Bacteroidales bacterium]